MSVPGTLFSSASIAFIRENLRPLERRRDSSTLRLLGAISVQCWNSVIKGENRVMSAMFTSSLASLVEHGRVNVVYILVGFRLLG